MSKFCPDGFSPRVLSTTTSVMKFDGSFADAETTMTALWRTPDDEAVSSRPWTILENAFTNLPFSYRASRKRRKNRGSLRVVHRETRRDFSHPRKGIPVTIETKFNLEAYDWCPSLALYEDNDEEEGKEMARAYRRWDSYLYRQKICKLRNFARGQRGRAIRHTTCIYLYR